MRQRISSREALDALPGMDVLLLASGRYPRGGTFHDCWVRPVPSHITGSDERAWEVLVYGETMPENVVGSKDIDYPATVLFHPDAP